MPAQQTPATSALRRAGLPYTLHEYAHTDGVTRYGAEAVAALGVDPWRVFKTLVARRADPPSPRGAKRREGGLIVGILPVPASLDLKALAAALGGKRCTLADPTDAARVTGYVVGGISPLGQRRPLPTALDESAGTQTTVFVSAGRRGLQLELAPADLLRLTGGVFAAIAAV